MSSILDLDDKANKPPVVDGFNKINVTLGLELLGEPHHRLYSFNIQRLEYHLSEELQLVYWSAIFARYDELKSAERELIDVKVASNRLSYSLIDAKCVT